MKTVRETSSEKWSVSSESVRHVEISWRKSSFSADTGNCVELASRDGEVLLRESDEPGVVVRTTPEKLRAFLAGVKAGEFDHLA